MWKRGGFLSAEGGGRRKGRREGGKGERRGQDGQISSVTSYPAFCLTKFNTCDS